MIPIVNEFFSFKKPRKLTVEEFNEIKQLLTRNPDFDFLSKFSFFNERKGLLLFLIIAFPLSLILISIQNEGVNIMIGGFLITACLMVGVFFIIPEYISFLKTKAKMKRYFKKLKKDIIHSDSYEDFSQKQYN